MPLTMSSVLFDAGTDANSIMSKRAISYDVLSSADEQSDVIDDAVSITWQ